MDELLNGINKMVGESTKETPERKLVGAIKSEPVDDDISKYAKSKYLVKETSTQHPDKNNFSYWDDERIKGGFNFGNGTWKDMERYMKDNKGLANFQVIRGEPKKEGVAYEPALGLTGDTSNIEKMQNLVNEQIKRYGRIGAGFYDELDQAGLYLDNDNKVRNKNEAQKPIIPTFEKGVAGKDYGFNENGDFSLRSRKVAHSSFEEPSVAYDDLSRFYGLDLEKLVYGDNGFMKSVYPNGLPDFAGDILYSEKYWKQFEDWLKQKYGVSLEDIKKQNEKEYRDYERETHDSWGGLPF